MVTETQELVVFHCVVKHASYARAAEELSLSASGVSRIVTRLEERLGARLVQRTTRKLALTEVGAAFHASEDGVEAMTRSEKIIATPPSSRAKSRDLSLSEHPSSVLTSSRTVIQELA